MPLAGKGLTQIQDNCFIHTVDVGGKSTAKHVVGLIVRQDTKDRPSPPDCLSEFDTAYTPFAKGHVMALELGGCDISANIVPQYGQWQGNARGAWRAMEVALANAGMGSDIFIADVDYGAGPFVNTHQAQLSSFNSGDKLGHWVEPRIPTRFRVWSVAHNWSAGGVAITDYFGADDDGKDGMIAALIAALPDGQKVFDGTIDAMPAIDREYWRGQMMMSFAHGEHYRYKKEVKAQNVVIKRKQEKLVEKAGGGKRVSHRLGIQDPVHKVSMPKLVVSLGMAQWLESDEVATRLVTKMQSADAPAAAVNGWTQQEKTTLTPAQLRAAVFSD